MLRVRLSLVIVRCRGPFHIRRSVYVTIKARTWTAFRAPNQSYLRVCRSREAFWEGEELLDLPV